MTDAWKIFGITTIVFLGIISAVLIASYISRECNTNLDCKEGEYCAFNHKCYSYSAYAICTENILPAAFVIGISLIVAAYIFKEGMKKK